MRITNRNLIIGIGSLIILAVVYWLINSLAGREPIIVEKPSPSLRPDSNIIRSGQIGRIGDVNIAELDNPVYTHLNEQGEVDREFTFKKILHAEGSSWQVEKPQISFFRSDLSVVVTADEADVQTETVLNQPRPKDATLSGNVIVHIQPKASSPLKEGFVYLDTISFESDSSRAFTGGPVKFVSEDIQLSGRSMEFVYNGEKRRLEFLKINDLNSLKFNIPAKSFLFQPPVNTASSSYVQTASSQNAGYISESQSQQKTVNADSRPLYRCLFNKFVSIDTPQQVIFTDSFLINNILLKQSAPSTDSQIRQRQTSGIKTDVADKTPKTDGSEAMMLVTIACKGGILLMPMDSPKMPQPADSTDTVTAGKAVAGYDNTKDKTVIIGRKLIFDASSNIADLQGDCVARLLTSYGAFERRYSLAAQRIEAAVTDTNDGQTSGGLKYLKADGGVVQLAVEKLEPAAGRLGFTKIKCFSLNYDPASQTFFATGPGLVAVDNSRLTSSEIDALKSPKNITAKFSIQKPCYALISDFASLEYNLKTDRILAQAGKNRMNIGYLPIIDGKEGPPIKATVGKLDAKLERTPAGQTELVKLYASDGVTYDEQGGTKTGRNKNIQLIGSDLIYDIENPANPLITVWGNRSWPCFLNGAHVDGIEYHLSTGRLKETKILAPAIFQ